MNNAIYPGSFDPLTLGHLDIIERGTRLFGNVVVGVLQNPNKSETFTLEKRIDQIRNACEHLRGIEIISFEGLTVSIEKSQLGKMLSIVGGRKALEPLRKPIINKLETLVSNMLETQKETKLDRKVVNNLHNDIEHLVDNRLNELSPNDIKKMIKDIIDNHELSKLLTNLENSKSHFNSF